jgi:hypothetical protein
MTPQPDQADTSCARCGDDCSTRYELHGWLCDECADPLAVEGTLYTDEERAAVDA